jgi:hypothetical protein
MWPMHTSQSPPADLPRGALAPRAAGTSERIAISLGSTICLMTDGDQTGALVEGWYGDITLQAR